MKILIIGGNRFFGKRLAELLLKDGAMVTLLNRGNIDDGFGNKIKRIKMDRKNFDPNHPELQGNWDFIFDQVCYDAPEARAAINTFKDKTPHYIFTSTQSVYGEGANVSESDFDSFSYRFEKDCDRNTDYGEAKRQAEAIFMQQKNFKITAVRFPYVLGADDYTQRLNFHIKKIMQNSPLYFPNINAKISFIHAQDAAQFLASLTKKELLGPINCACEAPLSLKNLLKMIEEVVQKKAVLSHEEGVQNNSPYGSDKDSFMNTNKLKAMGFNCLEIEKWLPELILPSVKVCHLKS